jgi:L-iditol 2-dehydrogenase
MKALELVDASVFQISDMPVPECKRDGVLIRVKACGICGSDIHGMDGSSGRRIPPIVMGHEASGEVIEVGSEVTDLNRGDRVTFDSTVYCGDCEFCKSARFNLCDRREVMGVSCSEFRRHGAYAEFVAVPARIVHRLPDSISFDHAAFAEPVGVALHAVSRIKITQGDSAVVVGSGLIGLLIIQVLKSAGCETIVAIDLSDERIQLALELGATHGFNANATGLVEEIKKLSNHHGTHHSFEVVGATPTVNLAVDCVRKGGNIVLVGNLAPDVQFPLQKAVTRELNVLGSCAINGEYPAALKAIASGEIKVEPLISARAGLDQGSDWFAKLKAGDEPYLKVLLCPELDD